MSTASYRCHACGARFTAWAPAERHGDNPGHHRIDVILSPEEKELPVKKTQRKEELHGQRKMGEPRPSLTAKSPPPPGPLKAEEGCAAVSRAAGIHRPIGRPVPGHEECDSP